MRPVVRVLRYVCVGVCSILLLGCPNPIDVARSGEHAGMIVLSMAPVGPDFETDDIRPSDYELYIGGLDGSGLQRLTWNDAADMHPDWSQDSSKIVYLREGFRLDEEGQESDTIFLAVYDFEWGGSFEFEADEYEFSELSYPDFGPNDTIVASTDEGGLVLVRYDGGAFVNPRAVYEGEDAFFPVWSPGGDWIAFNEDSERVGATDRRGRRVVFADVESLVGSLDELTTYRPIWVSSTRLWFTGFTSDDSDVTSYIFSFDVVDGRTEVVAAMEGLGFGYATLSPDGRHLVGLGLGLTDEDEERTELLVFHTREKRFSSFFAGRSWIEERSPLPVWSHDGSNVMIWDEGSFVMLSAWGTYLSSYYLGNLVYRSNYAE